MALSIIARLLGRASRGINSVRGAPPDSPEPAPSAQALSTPPMAAQPLRPADPRAYGDDDAALTAPPPGPKAYQEAAAGQAAYAGPAAYAEPEAYAGQAAYAGQDVPPRQEVAPRQRAVSGQEVQPRQEVQAGQEVPPKAARGAKGTSLGQEAPEGLGPSAALKGSTTSALPKHRIYHALGNSNQMLGCDRELFLINLLVAAALIFLSHSLVVFAVTTPVALLLFLGLHQMGKRDLLLRHVFIRQLHYQHYYLAQARIGLPPRKRY